MRTHFTTYVPTSYSILEYAALTFQMLFRCFSDHTAPVDLLLQIEVGLRNCRTDRLSTKPAGAKEDVSAAPSLPLSRFIVLAPVFHNQQGNVPRRGSS